MERTSYPEQVLATMACSWIRAAHSPAPVGQKRGNLESCGGKNGTRALDLPFKLARTGSFGRIDRTNGKRPKAATYFYKQTPKIFVKTRQVFNGTSCTYTVESMVGMQNQHEDEEHNKNVGSAVEGISRGGGGTLR